jgi:hypothetical protein
MIDFIVPNSEYVPLHCHTVLPMAIPLLEAIPFVLHRLVRFEVLTAVLM